MTKRILSVLLALLFAMTVFVACDKEPAAENNAENNNEVVAPVAENAEELLTKAYQAFAENLAPAFDMPAEDIMMAFMGGYYDENDETTLKQGPGNVPVDNDAIASIALLPADAAAKVDSAAMFQHPMMTNYFVGAAFRVTDAADVEAVANALKDAIANNHWMCGQPEGYYVITIGNFVVSTYGLMDNINALKDAIVATYEGAVVATEGSFIG
ncbi:MAG: hypothetical protein IKV39_01215 [Clostridia bacterium]|nr:hypothetical protein [Clostridia bacterium]